MMFFFDWKEYSAQEYLDNVSLLPRRVFDFQAVAVESKSWNYLQQKVIDNTVKVFAVC